MNFFFFQDFLSHLDSLLDSLESESGSVVGQRQVLAKIQKGLIKAKDIGDEKLAVVQAMTDIIENKTRQLEHDAKNLDFNGEEIDEGEGFYSGNANKQSGNSGSRQGTPGHVKAGKRQHEDKNEKPGKITK